MIFSFYSTYSKCVCDLAYHLLMQYKTLTLTLLNLYFEKLSSLKALLKNSKLQIEFCVSILYRKIYHAKTESLTPGYTGIKRKKEYLANMESQLEHVLQQGDLRTKA